MYQFKVKKPLKYKGDIYIRGDAFKVKIIDENIIELIEFYFIAPMNKSAIDFVEEIKINFGKRKEIKNGKTLLHSNTNKKRVK